MNLHLCAPQGCLQECEHWAEWLQISSSCNSARSGILIKFGARDRVRGSDVQRSCTSSAIKAASWEPSPPIFYSIFSQADSGSCISLLFSLCQTQWICKSWAVQSKNKNKKGGNIYIIDFKFDNTHFQICIILYILIFFLMFLNLMSFIYIFFLQI